LSGTSTAMAASLGTIDEVHEDIESLDITDCKERIGSLQAERERRIEYTERLQEKLKALNSELAARQEEAERKKRELQDQLHRNKELQEQRRDAGDGMQDHQDDSHKVRRFVEEVLREQEATKHAENRNEFGFRTFDETDLMVEKSLDEQNREQTYIDTVLVTFCMPHTELKYNLTYRVDRNTPSEKLRKDACLYWGISEVDYILKTVTGSKVCDQLTIQHCFKDREPARLLLMQKTPRNNSLMDTEKEAIRAIIGKLSRPMHTVTKTEDTQSKASVLPFHEQLRGVPGLYNFMIQRDRNKIEHLSRIRLRFICFYVILAVLTLLIIDILRPPNTAYDNQSGPMLLMTQEQVDLETMHMSPEQSSIETPEQVWDWLTYTVSNKVLHPNSPLRNSNYLPGWLRIRMQQVEPGSASICEPQDELPNWVTCTEHFYRKSTQGTENIEAVQSCWEVPNPDNTTSTTTTATGSTTTSTIGPTTTGPNTTMSTTTTCQGVAGTVGRALYPQPWQFLSAEDNREYDEGYIRGRIQRYDGSGYDLDYNLQYSDKLALFHAYRQDIRHLQGEDWISARTRAVHVSFTSYNADYDSWNFYQFLFEMPPNSLVLPSSEAHTYSPSIVEYHDELILLLFDIIRFVIVLYIVTLHAYWEMRFERRRGTSVFNYLLGPYGFCDFGIGITYLYIFIVRYIVLGPLFKSTEDHLTDIAEQFTNVMGLADLYRSQVYLEGLVITFTAFRLLTFLRVNRHIYILCSAIQESILLYRIFLFILLPAWFGMVLWAQSLFGTLSSEFTAVESSALSLIMLANGDVPKDGIFEAQRPWTIVFAVFFYVLMWLIIINGWIAVVCDVYQNVRVASGYDPKIYRWKEYDFVTFCLVWPFNQMYLKYLRPRIERPKGKDSKEDEDA